MSDGMGREPAYLSSHATNRYFIPNWGNVCLSISGCPMLWACMLVVNIPVKSEAQSKNFFTITFKSKVSADFGF